MNTEEETWIVPVMSDPCFYDHHVAEVEMIETHISWIFLAGEFAYKVKKPLDLGFLDFSTLAKRHHYCREELRLNRQFAPQLYLDLIQVGGSPQSPTMHRHPPLEYAVKMRRFPQDCQLDRMLAAEQLQARHLLAFASQIATLHQNASTAEADSPYGTPAAVVAPVLENFQQIRPLMKLPEGARLLERVERWTRKACEQLEPIFRERKDKGFVRACHGDIHLANMAWLDNQPLLFDCIEFNENLRWIDVINDIAFLVMDLDDRQQPALGWSFLNRYLQETGDYQGVTPLVFYKSYRAMVRAKVICMRLAQGHLSETERNSTEQLFLSYLKLAEQYSDPPPVSLIITHGLSGAGKSTFSSRLASQYGAIHLRSDIERKRLHGFTATADSQSPINSGIYSAQASTDTYLHLHDLAELILSAGLTVIIDATFIKRHQREKFYQLAKQLQALLVILDFTVPEGELRRRVLQREQGEAEDASEAGLEVLEQQLEHEEALTEDERPYVMTVAKDTTVESVIALLPGLC